MSRQALAASHGSSAAAGAGAEGPHDGTNRRIRKVVTGTPTATYDTYYNDKWQPLEVYKTDGVRELPLYRQYYWHPFYTDAPAFSRTDTDGEAPVSFEALVYYAWDANWNVTALLDGVGSVMERYEYDPYGNATIMSGGWVKRDPHVSWYDSDVLYCGYRYDAETGLYHVRNRMYHAQLGRWLQRDPKGYVDGLSLYEYCKSGPIDSRCACHTQKTQDVSRQALPASQGSPAAAWVCIVG